MIPTSVTSGGGIRSYWRFGVAWSTVTTSQREGVTRAPGGSSGQKGVEPRSCHARSLSGYTEASMDVTSADEAELLAAMTVRAANVGEARDAWGELFERHRRYVFVVVSRAYGSFLGEDGTVDLVCDTFRRAFEWAGRQENSDEVRAQFTGKDPDSTRRRVLGWLGAIAKQLFRDRYREESASKDEAAQFFDQWRSAQEHPAETGDSIQVAHIETALSSLGAAEAEALRVSLPWYDPESRTFNVPRGEAARLAAELQTTPDTLRQRRHRAIKRIEKHLVHAGYAAVIEEEST